MRCARLPGLVAGPLSAVLNEPRSRSHPVLSRPVPSCPATAAQGHSERVESALPVSLPMSGTSQHKKARERDPQATDIRGKSDQNSWDRWDELARTGVLTHPRSSSRNFSSAPQATASSISTSLLSYNGETESTRKNDTLIWKWGTGSEDGHVGLVPTTKRYFILNDNSGLLTIKEGTPPGTYNIRVRVIDGVWPDVISTVKVIVKEIKDDALHNAGSVRIKGITPEEFISQSPEKQSKYYQMKKLLSEIISVQLANVHIFSVLNSPSPIRGVDIWFAVYGPPYYKAEKLNGNVAASRAWPTERQDESRSISVSCFQHISTFGGFIGD
ncbi:hypothetical protein HGM15179_003096 [Zosterops borbonicus]|uniref:DE-cadherin-like Ig-like domain-containing protein n=1 Tax=Zosterops borbonicus TaxID=364589 RepID=A0A8K1GRM5_9PASS|nr:hypothetical protein HGM15179_003096 [Zosterops borbonicus]